MSAQNNTRTRIIDAAERQFAEHGYDAVSVRSITDMAGVRLGLLAYHFGTKEFLFESVIARRVDELNQRRLEALEAAQRQDSVDARAIINAFIEPYLILAASADPGWQAYTKLIAQISHTESHMEVLKRYLDPVGHRFIAALAGCFPETPAQRIASGFIFTAAAMVGVFSRPSRIESLSEGLLSTQNLHDLYPALLAYAVAGVNALCARSPDKA